MTDVRFPDRAQDGVANRVHQDVGIRMAVEPFGMGDQHTAQDEWAPLHQGVNIVTNANVNHDRRLGDWGKLTKQLMALRPLIFSQFTLTVNGLAGMNDTLWTSTDLVNWQALLTTNSPSMLFISPFCLHSGNGVVKPGL
jgi:hypothetical protein